MKPGMFVCLFFVTGLLVEAQENPLVGPLQEKKALLAAATVDTTRIRLMIDICLLEVQSRTDSSISYAQRAFDLASRIRYQEGIEWSLIYLGLSLRYLANYPKAIECEIKALRIAEELHDTKGLEYAYSLLGTVYQDLGYFETGLADINRSLEYGGEIGEVFLTTGNWGELALMYAEAGKLDSALLCQRKADSMDKKYHFYYPHIPFGLAYIYEQRGDWQNAIEYYRESGEYAMRNHFLRDILRSYAAVGRVQLKIGNADSAIYYAGKVVRDTVNHSIGVELEGVKILNEAYSQGRNPDSELKYLTLTTVLQDSLFGQAQARQVQNLNYNEALRQQGIAEQRSKLEAFRRKNVLELWFGGAVAAIVCAAFFVFYRYRLAQLKRIHSVRDNISRDLHDDIGSTLSSIHILGGIAEKKMENGAREEAMAALRKIRNYSYEMVEKMSDIVWAVNPKNDTVDNLVCRIKDAQAETCLQKGISLDVQVDTVSRKTKLTSHANKNLYLICKEAINNSIRHARCGTIEVCFKAKGDSMIVTITDDGRGFDVDHPPGDGNGLRNMRSRAQELKGSIGILAAQGRTQITVCIQHDAYQASHI